LKELIKKEAAKLNIVLDDEQSVRFEKYYELLKEWNEKINLTAITEKNDVAVKHFADSLGLVLLNDNSIVKKYLPAKVLKS